MSYICRLTNEQRHQLFDEFMAQLQYNIIASFESYLYKKYNAHASQSASLLEFENEKDYTWFLLRLP